MRGDRGADDPIYTSMMANLDPVQDRELATLVEAAHYPLRVVSKTEGLANLKGFEPAYVLVRDGYVGKYEDPSYYRTTLSTERTHYWAFAGRHMSYKRGAISEFLHLTRQDPHLIQKLGRAPEMKYVSFAPAALLTQLEGRIPPNEGLGAFSYESYAQATKTLWTYIAAEAHNYTHPKWVAVEATGPSAYINERGRIINNDRGFSALHRMATHFPDQTDVFVLMRKSKGGIMKKGLAFRQEVMDASPADMPRIFDKYKTQLVQNGAAVDLENWDQEKLAKLRMEIIDSQAPPAGVIRGNKETDALKKHMGIKDEFEFWYRLMTQEIGFKPGSVHIIENPYSNQVFSLHHVDLDAIDPIKARIDWIKGLMSGEGNTGVNL